MRQAMVYEQQLLKKRQVKFFLSVAAIFFLLTVQIKSQPGGCYSDTWQYEYCREERTALIKNFDSEIKKLDEKISREPRNADYYYQRGKIYTAMMFEKQLGFKNIEFDGQKYFADIDAKAIADFTRAIKLSQKSLYFNERGNIFLAYWERETNSFQYFYYYYLGDERKSDKEILQTLDKLFFNNQSFESAESDFRRAIELNTDSESAQSAAGRLSSLRGMRGFWLGNYEYVAELIGNTARADVALADFDYSIEQTKILTVKYKWSSDSIQGRWLAKAVAAKRFGKDDAALKALEEAVKLQEKDGFVNCAIYSTRAEIYFNQKKFESAIKDLTYAIENSSRCRNLIEQRGDVYLGKGETAKAIENYSLILDDKNYPSTKEKRIYWKRGKVYLQTGVGEKAADDFTTAIGSFTLCEKDYEFRARAFRLAGNEQAAKADEEKFLQVLKNQKKYQPSDYCYNHRQ